MRTRKKLELELEFSVRAKSVMLNVLSTDSSETGAPAHVPLTCAQNCETHVNIDTLTLYEVKF